MASKNVLFPGRPNYTGPTKGVFGLLHHWCLYEDSHDVNERINYVRNNKPANEVEIRLYNMIYLGGCPAAAKRAPLIADYKAKLALLDADYKAKRDLLHADDTAKRDLLIADYKAKLALLDADYTAKHDLLHADILAYIRKHIPDCAWDGKELRFS